ncbi:hypothetical protein [Donghicola sp. XS_ASV15]|uniref:hypothetical protein n=1 Tax=Donghicola sp. XS_ASV15 TaxID=3241295 RepID=UPI003517ECC5
MEDFKNAAFPKGLTDPDLVDLYPHAIARMVEDIDTMITLVAEKEFQRACFTAFKLHGIAALFRMDEFSAALTAIIESLENKDSHASVQLEDLGAKARLQLCSKRN